MDDDVVGQSLSPALVGRPGSRRGSVLVDLLLDAVDAEAEDTAARPLRDDDVDTGTGELELQGVARLVRADVAAERAARGLRVVQHVPAAGALDVRIGAVDRDRRGCGLRGKSRVERRGRVDRPHRNEDRSVERLGGPRH